MEAIDPFVFRLSIFALAIFVGYFVVWGVTPALHTPLMSVTNAISSVIIVGALIAVAVPALTSASWTSKILGFAALLYLVAGVLFILALKGLSSPASSRIGNRNGMLGMLIAILTTLWVAGVTDPLTWGLIVVGIAIGGLIGAVTAKRIAMTDMPQLVAAFHSLVGLAAVLTAAAALYSPAAFGIGAENAIRSQSLVEMSLGVAIGAITFAG